MYAPMLPYDVAQLIADYVPLQKVNHVLDVLSPQLSTSEKRSVYDFRASLPRYFKQLTNNPGELLRCMYKYGVVLSGSRATEYFSPGISTVGSDWDFYIPNDSDIILGFMHCLLNAGVAWDVPEPFVKENSRYPEAQVTTITGKVLTNTGTKVVQLIRPAVDGARAIDCLMGFHSSIVQCYISGTHAVCMYSDLTSNYKSVQWLYNDGVWATGIRDATFWANEDDALDPQKYVRRGITYITYDEYNSHANVSILGSGYLKLSRYRSYNDCLSYCYIPRHASWESESSLNSKRPVNLVTESLEWLESPYMMRATGNQYWRTIFSRDVRKLLDETCNGEWESKFADRMKMYSEIIGYFKDARRDGSIVEVPDGYEWLGASIVVESVRSLRIDPHEVHPEALASDHGATETHPRPGDVSQPRHIRDEALLGRLAELIEEVQLANPHLQEHTAF